MSRGETTFGRWVVEQRKARGIRQKDLSQMTGLAAAYLCDIEHGRRTPPIQTVERIADAFGASRWVALFRAGIVPPELLSKDRPDEAVTAALCRANDILDRWFVWPVGEKSHVADNGDCPS